MWSRFSQTEVGIEFKRVALNSKNGYGSLRTRLKGGRRRATYFSLKWSQGLEER